MMGKEMAVGDYREAGAELYDKLRCRTYPVAIKYISDLSQAPEGYFRPTGAGEKWTLCQAFGHARRWGMKVVMTGDDNMCVPSSFTHTWVDVSPRDAMRSQVLNKWYKNNLALFRLALTMLKTAPEVKFHRMLQVRKHVGFIVSPLAEVDFIPDVVLVYGTPGQLLHAILALSYDLKYPLGSGSSVGFAESCGIGGLKTFLTNRPQAVLPGVGDRSLSGASDNEMAIGIPGPVVFHVLENLFKTGKEYNPGMPFACFTHNNRDFTRRMIERGLQRRRA